MECPYCGNERIIEKEDSQQYMSKNQEIISIIMRECEERGISKTELSKALGCSRRVIDYWCSGERGISIDTADSALKKLGIAVTIGDEHKKGKERRRGT